MLAAGDAKAPPIAASDQVTVNYRGKLIDGTEFDSSFSRGQPATFGVSGVIKGWQEALVMMKPGARWQLYVPAELAYGAESATGNPGQLGADIRGGSDERQGEWRTRGQWRSAAAARAA